MIDYIKIIILALVTGVTMPLPTSSAAHFSLVSDVISFSDSGDELSFIYSVFSIVFAVVVFILLRKIYGKSIKSLFVRDAEELASYKKISLNLFLSILPAFLLLVPISEEKLLIDYFSTFVSESGILLSAFAGIMSSLILVVAIWYTKQNYAKTKRISSWKNVLRASVYQLISHVVPGMSHVTIGGVNYLLCDIDSKVLVREILLYLAPQMFVVGAIRVIRMLIADIVVDPLVIIIGCIVFALCTFGTIKLISKVNIRRLFVFFAIYTAAASLIAAVLSFVI